MIAKGRNKESIVSGDKLSVVSYQYHSCLTLKLCVLDQVTQRIYALITSSVDQG